MPTIEEQIAIQVDERVKELMPELIQQVKQETVYKQTNQTLFTQKEMAEKLGISISTFRNWRKMGLESEPSPTRNLLFDYNKVEKWREKNDTRKVR